MKKPIEAALVGILGAEPAFAFIEKIKAAMKAGQVDWDAADYALLFTAKGGVAFVAEMGEDVLETVVAFGDNTTH